MIKKIQEVTGLKRTGSTGPGIHMDQWELLTMKPTAFTGSTGLSAGQKEGPESRGED